MRFESAFNRLTDRTRRYEVPKGESLTQPNQSYTVREIIEKQRNGLTLTIAKPTIYEGEEIHPFRNVTDLSDIDRLKEMVQKTSDAFKNLKSKKLKNKQDGKKEENNSGKNSSEKDEIVQRVGGEKSSD